MTKQLNSIFTLPNNKGTYTVIEKELHFLDCFSKEWEPFNKDYEFVITEKDMKKLKNKLGSFQVYKN
jgi:hypothetical protein